MSNRVSYYIEKCVAGGDVGGAGRRRYDADGKRLAAARCHLPPLGVPLSTTYAPHPRPPSVPFTVMTRERGCGAVSSSAAGVEMHKAIRENHGLGATSLPGFEPATIR